MEINFVLHRDSLKCLRNIHVQIRCRAPREGWAINSALETIFLRGDNEYIKATILLRENG